MVEVGRNRRKQRYMRRRKARKVQSGRPQSPGGGDRVETTGVLTTNRQETRKSQKWQPEDRRGGGQVARREMWPLRWDRVEL